MVVGGQQEGMPQRDVGRGTEALGGPAGQAALLPGPWSLEFQKESPHKEPGSRGNGRQERWSVTWGDWPQD